ncbi:araC-type DNA-binding domain-containing protein [Gynuella sunshinyii YC6258]|uniref:AraC-type DNA-binding domain-containing protein n=2 Tax=Gynuella sunshinyii TaxID=1445505 RepID=A0A0C5VFS4_9GAMM|nr:araC-type DNA-binding domain-containing protein [Gynuella sunshinyii YC6258]
MSTMHRHDFAQLVLPLHGVLELQVGNTAGQVDDSRLAVIRSGVDHGFSAGEDNLFIVIDLPHSVSRICEQLPPFVATDAALKQYIQFMYQQLSMPQLNPVIGYSMVSLLLQLLMQAGPQALPGDRRLNAALQYVQANLATELTLNQVAVVANVSVRQLHQLFIRHVGLSPGQYIQQQRMQRASQLLTTTRLTVQQIADQCGYQNLSAFSDRFRQLYGQSPSTFRLSPERQTKVP